MEPLVDVVCEDLRWEVFGPDEFGPDGLGLEALADAAVRAAFRHLGLPVEGFTLCVMGCDDARIAGLNAGFRGKPQATNVLSWPAEDRATPGMTPALPQPGPADDPDNLGDIALAYETCAREAMAAAKPLSHHVSHLVVHGLLHLLGYDHVTDADATLMQGCEVRILATLGLSDPY